MPSPKGHAVVTGAANGLGRALACALVRRGWRVSAFDTDAAGLKRLEGELGLDAVRAVVQDVADRPGVGAAIAAAEAERGPVELLVANAGVGRAAAAFSAELVERTFAVNVLGACNVIAAVLPGMLARRRGQIAGIGSLAAVRGFPTNGPYSASKAALMTQLEALRVELKPHGIAVTTVAPGFIATAMVAGNRMPMPLMMTPEVAAERTLAAIEARRGFAAFPRRMAVFSHVMRLMPASWFDRVAKPYMLADS